MFVIVVNLLCVIINAIHIIGLTTFTAILISQMDRQTDKFFDTIYGGMWIF